MLATGVIVFREALEAALIIGIALAASRGVPRRFAFAGIGVGVTGEATDKRAILRLEYDFF